MNRIRTNLSQLLLALLTGLSTTQAAVIYTTDNVNTLTGSFSFDVVNDGSGVATDIAVFPHFHIGLGGGYVAGDTVFRVFDAGANFALRGEDKAFPAFPSAQEDYDPTGQPMSYPDRMGTFLSPFDGTSTIKYSYTNVGFSSPDIFTGDFSFTVVPEPSALLLSGIGLAFFGRRRPRSERPLSAT